MHKDPRARQRDAAIILRQGKLLLIRRWNARRGNYFAFPGGGVEEGETPEATVVRELMEEGGVTITVDRLFAKTFISEIYEGQTFLLAQLDNDQEPVWQEIYKQSETDTYAFEWLETELLGDSNVLPHEIRDQLVVWLNR